MSLSLFQIAEATGLELVGDGDLRVDRPMSPQNAGTDDLALAMSETYSDALKSTAARAAVLWSTAELSDFGLKAALLAPRPRVAMAHLTGAFAPELDVDRGIHPSAIVADSADVGDDAWIGPFVVIGEQARIGRGARIAAHVTIGSDAKIGSDAIIESGARVGARSVLGDRCRIHANAVIGADGFSFEPPERGNVEAAKQTGSVETAAQTSGFLRIHSLAGVLLGDDVEIGAATTIDRGTIEPTRIGSGTKIDNQVQVGHNVQIGQTCLICAQVGIAGSTRIGDRVVLGGKTGVGDHVKIGSDVVCAASTMVASNVPHRSVMMGIPAVQRKVATQQIMAMRRLPRALEQIAEMRKKLGL